MAFPSQETLPLQIQTPFGSDKLKLKSFSGEESISGLYSYRLELVSEDDDLDFSAIIGQGITVIMPLPDGREEFLHGIVSRFVHTGAGPTASLYYADVRPEFWLLTLSSNCRIFQNNTTEQIIDSILQEMGIAAVQKNLTGSYKAREFCVQYCETNFQFLSRLMEEEGIFYFFKHEIGKHTMVIADNPGAYAEYAGLKAIQLRESHATWTDEESISSCSIEEQTVAEKYKTSDYNFEVPDTDLVSTIGTVASKHEIYDYPANSLTMDDLDSRAKLMLEALSAPRRILRGASACRGLRAGVKFTLTGHRREDVNAEYVVRRVSCKGDSAAPYANSFEAQPVDVPFRPARTTPRPRIYGAQTATVVGKTGDTVMADPYGRIRVHFHWDRLGKKDENASCPIRVSHLWAGKNWGSLFVPRVGQEVVVNFLDGNPDRPIITGSVYNGGMPTPYDPSSQATVSTIKTSSLDGKGFNELRFEDKKGSEEFAIHAHKDFKLETLHDAVAAIGNNQTITVKNQRAVTIEGADDNLTVAKGNRAIKVEKGNETHAVKGTRTLAIEGVEAHETKADYTLTVGGNFTLTVKGNLTIETDSGSVVIKGASIETTAKQVLSNRAETIRNDADHNILNKAGISQTLEGGVSVSVKGPVIKLN